MTLLEALDVLIVHLGDDTPSTPKTERARAILRAALRCHERTRQMSSDTNKTIAAGLPLTSDAYAKPPLNIPGDDGRPYKTELVIERSPERTVKINWWHAPDDAGSRARPHNHPWDFTSTVLHGAITHTRYLSGSGGTPEAPRILTTTETIRAGESYTVRAYEHHLVVYVEPGTVTRMECGPLGGTEPPGASWGYLDTVTGEHVPATPDPEFRARLAAINPWMAAK